MANRIHNFVPATQFSDSYHLRNGYRVRKTVTTYLRIDPERCGSPIDSRVDVRILYLLPILFGRVAGCGNSRRGVVGHIGMPNEKQQGWYI